MQLIEAYIVSSVRTPVGRAYRGALRNVPPVQLGAVAVRGAVAKVAGLAEAGVEDVLMGCAFPEGPQGMNMGRAIAQQAGLPDEVTGATINRFCSSGLQTIAQAVAAVQVGQAECVVAGGTESMSKVPMGGFFYSPDPVLVHDDPDFYSSMGITAENVAERYGISREDQDEFALRSHQRALAALDDGRFDEECVAVPVRESIYEEKTKTSRDVVFHHARDEGPRADTSMGALARLKPVFKRGGTVTAGNASQMNDGAAASVVISEARLRELGLEPMARLVGYAVAGVAPEVMGVGPVSAVPKVLERCGLQPGDIDLYELNEAFAAQALAVVRELDLDPERVNVNGGAIALGHPLGCTGAKLTATLLHELRRRRARYGVVTMCIGGGMGAAAVFENLMR